VFLGGNMIDFAVCGMNSGYAHFHYYKAPFGIYEIRIEPLRSIDFDGAFLTPTSFNSVVLNGSGGCAKYVAYAFSKKVRV
jgi:hypothetical protein